MKRWIATLGVMLLMPTLAMAQGEMVSISELRGQVEQMGRWKEKYDTPNGEVSVDVPIILPEVERCPVVTVENQKPWNETMIREIQKKTGKRDGETFCSYDIDGQTVEIQLLTNGNGSTTKYEAVKDVTIQAGQYAADSQQMVVEWKYPELCISGAIYSDAQTGELKIITTGDEKTFSVPKVMTWAELAEKTGGVFERR